MNEATVPAAHQQALPEHDLVCAAPGWERVEFISDLHLRPEDPATVAAWLSYLEHGRFDALFILGDLFELWFGDDMLQRPPEASGSELLQRSVAALQAASARAPVYLMHGNRDFLLGGTFAQRSGVRLIADPCVLEFANQRWLLSHGDAWCLEDRSYQAFRQLVRAPAWQQGFLARPLAEREALARMARHTSESQRSASSSAAASAPDAPDYGDVDTATACQWLRATGCQTLIHGHTHRPGQHDLELAACRTWGVESENRPQREQFAPGSPPHSPAMGPEDGAKWAAAVDLQPTIPRPDRLPGLQRLVLSDWCGLSQPPRREVLRLDRQGQVRRLSPEQAAAPTAAAQAPAPAA